MKLWVLAIVLALVCTGPQAEPYRPTADDEVLERLPPATGAVAELRAQRALLASGDLGGAIALARAYLELGRAEYDPRYFGYAEGVIAPWLHGPGAPAEIWVLKASLSQNRHDFDRALGELDRALAAKPRLPQAWLTRAVIHEVRGEYAEATKNCWMLGRLAPGLLAATCLNSVSSLVGQAKVSYDRLAAALAGSDAEPAERLWALTTLAEMAERLGNPNAAERHYRDAAKLKIPDGYLLAAYGDFLLDRNRPDDVVALLSGHTRADPLLLRLTLAEQRLGHLEFRNHVDALEARFDASRRRGDASHQADEARYALHLRNDPARALSLALANWMVQREPRDARILLEAARAAGQWEAARPVLEHLDRSRQEDVRLELLKTGAEGSGT